MSIHNDLAAFLRVRTSVNSPIIAAYSSSPITNFNTDQRLLQRVCYMQGPQNSGSFPYLVFSGPFQYDAGMVSEGAVSQKKALFWFTCYSNYINDAMDWVTALEKDFVALFVPGFTVALNSVRLTSMIYELGTKHPAFNDDQVLQTGKENAMSAAMIAFQIGWQE